MGLQQKIDDVLESITIAIVEYETSKEPMLLTVITDAINEALDVNYSLLWKFDSKEKRLVSIGSDAIERKMDKSLLYQVWQKKAPLIENYLISHKSYTPNIDNPLAYHLKSMLIYPFVEKKTIIGFLVIAKEAKNRGLLERDLYPILEKFQTILAPLIKQYKFHQDKIVSIDEADKDLFTTKVEEKIENTVSSIDYKSEVKILEEKMSVLHTSNKELHEAYEALLVVATDEKNLSEELNTQKEHLLLENDRLKKEIVDLKSLDVEKDALYHEKYMYEEKVKKLQASEIISRKQVSYLESKVKILQEESRLLKQEKVKEGKEFSPYNIHNMAQLLPQILPTMGRYLHIYMLYEFIMYESQVSNMRMYDIEEKIKKSKILWELFKDDRETKSVPLYVKPIEIEMFISKLEMFQVILLNEQIRLGIQALEGFPVSMIIDSEKVLSTCFHLIHDITAFVDMSEDLNITLDYVDSVLIIYIRGKKHESLDRLLNKKKFTAMVKERTGLMMAKKLVGILSGDLESYMDEVDCIHQLSIPISTK